MRSFQGKLAVVTGGGTGMGRELVLQLAAEGCDVATCDIHADTLERTVADATGARVTGHVCDVSKEEQVLAFRDQVVAQHDTDHIDLLFNNAGIGGGGSFLMDDRATWERVFGVCWWGVYYCSRAFVPLVVKSDEGYIVNTSSVNGFWACLGPGVPHTAYSTAKFAVKGFSEALITDLAVNAPHVKVAVVMPGHIGTEIVINTARVHGQPRPDEMGPEEIARVRDDMETRGMPVTNMSDDDIRNAMRMLGEGFKAAAPVSAAQAATVILDGVRNDEWRILIGDDARALDESVRADPLNVYSPSATTIPTVGFSRG